MEIPEGHRDEVPSRPFLFGRMLYRAWSAVRPPENLRAILTRDFLSEFQREYRATLEAMAERNMNPMGAFQATIVNHKRHWSDLPEQQQREATIFLMEHVGIHGVSSDGMG